MMMTLSRYDKVRVAWAAFLYHRNPLWDYWMTYADSE